MAEIIVAAFPEDAAKVVLVENDSQLKETVCWAYEIMQTIDEYAEDSFVSKITFFGPQTYVEPFAEEARNNHPGVVVEIGQM